MVPIQNGMYQKIYLLLSSWGCLNPHQMPSRRLTVKATAIAESTQKELGCLKGVGLRKELKFGTSIVDGKNPADKLIDR